MRSACLALARAVALAPIPLCIACTSTSTGGPPSPADLARDQSAAGNGAAKASSDFEHFVTSGNADPVGALVASIKADPNVATVERFDDDATVVASFNNGSSFSLFLADKSRAEWRSHGAKAGSGAAPHTKQARLGTLTDHEARTMAAQSQISCDPKSYPQSKKACIVQAFSSEFHQDLKSINTSLSRAGFTATNFSLKTPQDLVTLQAALPTCGVLYISTHGGRAKNLDGNFGNHITTEIQLGLPDKDKFASNLTDMVEALGGNLKPYLGVTGHGKTAYWTLSPEFFASANYPNTMVYIDACSSDKEIPAPVLAGGGKQLRDVFRSHGAGAFLGWKGPISNQVSDPAANEIFDGLAPKLTANIDSVAVHVDPPHPSASESYTVSADISPPQAGVPIHASVRGTDKFAADDTAKTDAKGHVTLTTVPGAESGVEDTITVTAGGAESSATVHDVVESNPTLTAAYFLPWFPSGGSVSGLTFDSNEGFNLICTNEKLAKMQSFVKF